MRFSGEKWHGHWSILRNPAACKMFISEKTVIQNDVPDSCYFSVLPQSSNNSDIIEQESVFVRYFFYFIYLIAFTTAEKKGCGGGRTTEQGSKLSAPFLPSQP